MCSRPTAIDEIPNPAVFLVAGRVCKHPRVRMTRRLREWLRAIAARLPLTLRRALLVGSWKLYERGLALRGGVGEPVEDSLRDEWPLPPVRLRVSVIADPDPTYFLRSGRDQLDLTTRLLTRSGVSLGPAHEALDFGCGCGRMARWWPTVFEAKLFGCDYNPDLVDWCDHNLAFMDASVNELEPPLPYPSGKFNFIYALSIFTHLPRDLEQAWLAELRRVLAPGGHLLFSVSGEGFTEGLSAEELATYEAGEAVVRFPEGAGSNLCATYHPPEYVRRDMLRGVTEIDSYKPVQDAEGRWRGPLRQDAYLAQALKQS